MVPHTPLNRACDKKAKDSYAVYDDDDGWKITVNVPVTPI